MTPAEQAVLSAIIGGSGKAVADLHLTPTDFSTPVGEVIYQHVLRLAEEGRPADAATMATVATTDHTLKAAGGPLVIWDQVLEHYVPESSAAHHAEAVALESARRQLDMAATSVRQGVADGRDVDQLVAETQSRLEQIASTSGVETELIGEGIDETIASLDRKPTYIETPWDDLNRLMHGWKRGGMYVIGARPSVGKTVAGLQAALSLCNMGPVAFTSLEMDRTELQKRILSHLARVDMGRIERHAVTNQDREAMARARHLFDHMPLHIDPSEEGTVSRVVKHARKVKRDYGLAGVVVDYIGLLSGARGQSEYEVVTDASKRLKRLAQELEVPVIALSQLNRGIESRDTKEPRLSDLRNSGSLEQDADVVMLMHRDLMNTPHELKLIVAKNRQGSTGEVHLDFAGHFSEMRNPH